jgi:hypothetical protein
MRRCEPLRDEQGQAREADRPSPRPPEQKQLPPDSLLERAALQERKRCQKEQGPSDVALLGPRQRAKSPAAR